MPWPKDCFSPCLWGGSPSLWEVVASELELLLQQWHGLEALQSVTDGLPGLAAVWPSPEAIPWNLSILLHSSGQDTKDFGRHKETYLVCSWVHWSPKYVLCGSYKRSKIPSFGLVMCFSGPFDGPSASQALLVLTFLLTDPCLSLDRPLMCF
jgi:hypothetical protein